MQDCGAFIGCDWGRCRAARPLGYLRCRWGRLPGRRPAWLPATGIFPLVVRMRGDVETCAWRVTFSGHEDEEPDLEKELDALFEARNGIAHRSESPRANKLPLARRRRSRCSIGSARSRSRTAPSRAHDRGGTPGQCGPEPTPRTASTRASERLQVRLHRRLTRQRRAIEKGLFPGPFLTPRTGLEPVTLRLTAGCSTN